MSAIDGQWRCTYVADPEEHDVEEVALITLKDGVVSGEDPHGGIYSGSYTLDGERFEASLDVTSDDPEAITVFPGVPFPLHVDLEGSFTSPDFFSAIATVNGEHELVLNCQRQK